MTGIAVLSAAVRQRRQQLDRLAGRAQQVAKAGQETDAEIERLAGLVELHAKTGAVLTSVGEEAQANAQSLFEDLSTRALEAIFGEGLSFRFEPGETGGQVTLEPLIRSDFGGTVIETGVADARGGGMVAVTGFVLRLVMVMLSPGVRKIIFLDETFAFVSAQYRRPLGSFLRYVADRTGVQIVMITHDPVYAEFADTLWQLELGPDGVTQVREGESE